MNIPVAVEVSGTGMKVGANSVSPILSPKSGAVCQQFSEQIPSPPLEIGSGFPAIVIKAKF